MVHHILSFCAILSLLGAAGGDADLLGMEEIRALAASAKQHMTRSYSVHLFELNPSQWGCIRKNAGACHEVPVTIIDLQGITSVSLNSRAKGQ